MVTSNLACETNKAMIFVSSFDSVNSETESVIKNLFENDGQIRISKQKMQKRTKRLWSFRYSSMHNACLWSGYVPFQTGQDV